MVGRPTSPGRTASRRGASPNSACSERVTAAVDQVGEQRRQRVGQLLDDAGPDVDRRRVGHAASRSAGRASGQRQRGDRPGLHDEELAVRAGPLDVLRRAEVVLDPRRRAGPARRPPRRRAPAPARRSAGTGRSSVPVGRRTRSSPPCPRSALRLHPARRLAPRTRSSVLTGPPTTDSPSPQAALITASSRRPLVGLAVNITPAASASTISWTTTARLTVAGSMPWRAR